MASLGGTTPATDTLVASSRLDDLQTGRPAPRDPLDTIHGILAEGAPDPVRRLLEAALVRAKRMAQAGGQNPESLTTAAQVYVADVVVGLAAEGVLDPSDTQVAVGALSQTCYMPLAAARFDFFLRAVSSPLLIELPPVVAAEIQLKLLIHLDVALEVSLWRRAIDDEAECLICLGCNRADRNLRAEARAALTGRSGVKLLRRSPLHSKRVYLFGAVGGAIVARLKGEPGYDSSAYLDVAALSLSPVLERERLLERSAVRERALLKHAENRLTRFGFDLHDGPIQDVLALAAETRELRDHLYPFVLESHRDLVYGRFDDLMARVVELDRQLRETAHSLESLSIASRPLAEILHREVEAFSTQSGIETSLTFQGDPESLSPQQRVAIFRAIQESLTNVREHSGATKVEVRVQMRRNSVDVRVMDNGRGFEVNRSLALAAQRGRLGVVGMGERMRMLGGSFEIDSRTGGPTVLRFSLPRWEPFEPVHGGHR